MSTIAIDSKSYEFSDIARRIHDSLKRELRSLVDLYIQKKYDASTSIGAEEIQIAMGWAVRVMKDDEFCSTNGSEDRTLPVTPLQDYINVLESRLGRRL